MSAVQPSEMIEIVVVGAHLSGMPLNGELTSRGGQLLRAGETTRSYRLNALPGGPPKRPGLIRIAEGEGHAIAVETHSARPHAPGQLLSHYAPHAELRLNADAPRAGEAYLGFGPLHAHGPWTLSASGDLIEAAASLFRLLHEIDATGVARIAVAPVPHLGLGEAINDRLLRAAAPRENA